MNAHISNLMASSAENDRETATAVQLHESLDALGFPPNAAWQQAKPLNFCADWQGKNSDPYRETVVRLLWTSQTLFLKFDARYRAITVFPDAASNGRRDQLWDRDVAEVFLQTEVSHLKQYKEFEISPNGYWIDLDIAPGEKHDLKSGLQRRVSVDKKAKLWTAEMALPMSSLVAQFDSAAIWRVNFYRVEGPAEPRFYSAWRPTHTPEPNFHVPEAFGQMLFVKTPRI